MLFVSREFNRMKAFRLITLDVMGTLMDISAPVGVGYSEAAAKFGINISPQLLTTNFKKVWQEMKIQHPNYGLHTGLGWEKWWCQLVHNILIISSERSLDSVTLNAISHHLIHKYNNPDQWKCCDGAFDFVRHVHKQGIPLAVISNFDQRLEELLEGMNVRKYFRFVVASYTAGFEKPDERIFKVAENIARSFEDLQDIKSSDILHIGDTPELDYIPAKNAGWNAYLVSKDSNEILKKYPNINENFIFKDFHLVKDLFK